MKTKQETLYALADYAIRVIAADALKNVQLFDQTNVLRSLPKIINKATANAAATAAYGITHSVRTARTARTALAVRCFCVFVVVVGIHGLASVHRWDP